MVLEDGKTWNNEEELDSLGEIGVDALKELIEDINEAIEEREDLRDEFLRTTEKMKTDIKNFLLENAPKGEMDSEFARERTELRKKQIDISELQLNEKIGCWRDVALLKKELRAYEKELNERENRAKMIEKILKE